MSEPVGNSPRGEIRSNSLKNRDQPPSKPVVEEPREKAEKIVTGKVVRRKTPWYKKVAGSIVADDAQSIGDFILLEVLVPATKNLLYDIINQGSSKALFGTARSSRRERGNGGSNLRTRYGSMSESPRERPPASRESRGHSFDDLVFEHYSDATEALEDLLARIAKFNFATVADLYDVSGVTASWADRKWGWYDLDHANIQQSRDGFLLDLPSPQPIR